VPANNATWRIGSDRVEHTDEAPDLSVDVDVLAAAYLGGPSWAALAGTGAVEVANGQAIEVADALFASRPLPYCGTFF
jgi:predicted acetyltransferase